MSNKKKKEDPIFGEPIYSYTRAQAIADGVLVDVTETAKEAGFKRNTVVTQKLWADIRNIPSKYDYESKEGRLWDVALDGTLCCWESSGTITTNL